METAVTRVNRAAELATLTKPTFLTDYSVENVNIMCRKINDFPAVFEAKMPTLYKIERAYGDVFLTAYIEGWIVNCIDFFNVGKQMSESQIRQTAIFIIDDFSMLTLADINMVFKRAKTGYYGELFNRIDGQIILSWFRKHFDDRCNAACELSDLEADKHKYEEINFGSGRRKADIDNWQSIKDVINLEFSTNEN